MGITHKIIPSVIKYEGEKSDGTLSEKIGLEYCDRELEEFLHRHFPPGKTYWILVEYPYVDKDFRSVYYNFYAKRALRMNTFCVRLHFFSDKVSYLNGLLSPENLQEIYLGFAVLRPTYFRTLGRTVIKPETILNASGFCLKAKHTVHLYGNELTVSGFPFMTQHTDISVCAHVVCWSIVRYFSEAFSIYPQKLIHDITQMAAPLAQGGIIPSRGLTVAQAQRIFSLSGFYPDMYNREEFVTDYFRILYSYLESGFPVFAALGKRRHAITLFGHGPLSKELSLTDNADGVTFSFDTIKTFVMHDDNYLMYQLIGKGEGCVYPLEDITAFVVPLPEKVYLPSEDVLVHVRGLFEENVLVDYAYIPHKIVRHFITTSHGLKVFIREKKEEMPEQVFCALMELPMSKFVWVVEIADPESAAQEKCLVRMVFDATANRHESYPFFLIHDNKVAHVYDRMRTKEQEKIAFSGKPYGPMSNYDHNLDKI